MSQCTPTTTITKKEKEMNQFFKSPVMQKHSKKLFFSTKQTCDKRLTFGSGLYLKAVGHDTSSAIKEELQWSMILFHLTDVVLP
jgi:hypothetical protein